MSLINSEINLILTWSGNCLKRAGTVANQLPTFARTVTKVCVLVVTLSTEDNKKLLQRLKSGF